MYAIRKDGKRWRAIGSPSDVEAYEDFSADQPSLISAPVSITVTPWQIRKALNQLSLRASVEAAVAGASQEVKDGWEFATEFRSDNELIAQLCTTLGKTEAERVALFQLAAAL